MLEKTSKYKKLGVDPKKSNVRNIFTKYINNDYPNAFVNIVTSSENSDDVFTMHMDGDGSKIVQRILYYLETKDENIFQGAVDDAISMNTGDISASGFVEGRWVITDIININALNLPKDIIMEQIAKRFHDLIKIYKKNGFDIYFLGGETADLPTQISSMVFDVGIQAKTKKWNIIKGNVQSGDSIYGFASDGQASWEKKENSGIMSNGVTLARVELMSEEYSRKYPYLGNEKIVYKGRYKIEDKPKLLMGMTVSEAILSPTRQWAILIKMIIEELKLKGKLHLLHGISINTGGGANKITCIGNGILYKKNMPDVPPIFKLIQQESNESWENMFETFNCGVGIDIIGENNSIFEQTLKNISKKTNIKLFDLGICEKNISSNQNKVILETPYGVFNRY